MRLCVSLCHATVVPCGTLGRWVSCAVAERAVAPLIPDGCGAPCSVLYACGVDRLEDLPRAVSQALMELDAQYRAGELTQLGHRRKRHRLLVQQGACRSRQLVPHSPPSGSADASMSSDSSACPCDCKALQATVRQLRAERDAAVEQALVRDAQLARLMPTHADAADADAGRLAESATRAAAGAVVATAAAPASASPVVAATPAAASSAAPHDGDSHPAARPDR